MAAYFFAPSLYIGGLTVTQHALLKCNRATFYQQGRR